MVPVMGLSKVVVVLVSVAPISESFAATSVLLALSASRNARSVADLGDGLTPRSAARRETRGSPDLAQEAARRYLCRLSCRSDHRPDACAGEVTRLIPAGSADDRLVSSVG